MKIIGNFKIQRVLVIYIDFGSVKPAKINVKKSWKEIFL